MRMKMKRVFRRNQIIITTLAIMIAAAGYLNYAGKSDLPGADTYEAGRPRFQIAIYIRKIRRCPEAWRTVNMRRLQVLTIRERETPLAAGSEEAQRRGRRTERRHLRTIRQSITRARRF